MAEMQKRKSPKSTINKIEDLVVYIHKITNNDKQFPKAYRYSLTNLLRNTSLHLYVTVYVACNKRVRNSNDAKQLGDALQNAYTFLVQLNGLLCIASKIVNIKNPEYLYELYDAADESLTNWVKSTKRLKDRMVAYEKELERKKKMNRDTIRDKDGFIVIKRII